MLTSKKNKLGLGFTLIELLVVISIIGLLSSILLVAMSSARSKGRYTKTLGDVVQLGKALELYYNTNNSYPADTGPDGDPGLVPNFISRWPKPPCNGWTYDWENWPASSNTFRITVRRADVGQIFYFCVKSDDVNCAGGAIDIKTSAVKEITCQE